MNLSGIDLNLLVVLDALLQEQHVTRAAQRVGLSQPATSNALARLRRLLDDAILVRDSKGRLVPTPRAQTLGEPLRRILGELREVLDPMSPFDAMSARRTFTVVANDYMQAVLLPAVARRLAAEAPGVDLVVLPPLTLLDWRGLVSGGADVAILPTGAIDLPRGLHRRSLQVDPLVCIARKRHPHVGERLTLKTYSSLPHVMMSPGGVGGPSTVDTALARLGLRRRIAMKVAYFEVAPLVVANSDLIATVPSTIARTYARPLGLRVFRVPLEVPPIEHSLVWHDRSERAPDHRWLRDRLVEIAATVSTPSP